MSFIDSGTWKKNGAIATIKFTPGVVFKKPPTVLVSSYWEGEHTEVGHVETIDTIEQTHFTVHSGNWADNYRVNWIAIGEKQD